MYRGLLIAECIHFSYQRIRIICGVTMTRYYVSQAWPTSHHQTSRHQPAKQPVLSSLCRLSRLSRLWNRLTSLKLATCFPVARTHSTSPCPFCCSNCFQPLKSSSLAATDQQTFCQTTCSFPSCLCSSRLSLDCRGLRIHARVPHKAHAPLTAPSVCVSSVRSFGLFSFPLFLSLVSPSSFPVP